MNNTRPGGGFALRPAAPLRQVEDDDETKRKPALKSEKMLNMPKEKHVLRAVMFADKL